MLFAATVDLSLSNLLSLPTSDDPVAAAAAIPRAESAPERYQGRSDAAYMHVMHTHCSNFGGHCPGKR